MIGLPAGVAGYDRGEEAERMKGRPAVATAAAFVLVAGLAGCAGTFSQACTLEWTSWTVHVHVAGSPADVANVAYVGYCGGIGCTPRYPTVAPSPSAMNPSPSPIPQQTNHNDTTWTIPTGHTRPARGTVAAYAADGTTIRTDTARLRWEDDNATAQCTGPWEASATLHIP